MIGEKWAENSNYHMYESAEGLQTKRHLPAEKLQARSRVAQPVDKFSESPRVYFRTFIPEQLLIRVVSCLAASDRGEMDN
jgi:hypothetical protein